MMAENLFVRVRRLVSGSLGDLADAMEKAGGETVMREAIREVDRAIDDVRAELGRVGSKRLQAARHVKLTLERVDELTRKAQFSLTQGREDLAEAAIARQVDLEVQIPILEATQKEALAEEEKLEACRTALMARKRDMEADLAAWRAGRSDAVVAGIVQDDRVARVEKRAEQARAAFDRASGFSSTPDADPGASAKFAEIDRLARQARIAERVAALRAPNTSPAPAGHSAPAAPQAPVAPSVGGWSAGGWTQGVTQPIPPDYPQYGR
jgi:phage shock protein A